MIVSYVNGIPKTITIDNVTYSFKRYKAESNNWLYSVNIKNQDYVHNDQSGLAVINFDSSIDDIYVSAEKIINKNFTGNSELYVSPSWMLRSTDK